MVLTFLAAVRIVIAHAAGPAKKETAILMKDKDLLYHCE